MDFVRKTIGLFLGYHEVDDYIDQIDPDQIRTKAKPIDALNSVLMHTLPIKGIYKYFKNGEEHFIKKTYLGYFYSFSFSLILTPKVRLVPQITRVFLGSFILFFYLFGSLAAIGAFIEDWRFGIIFTISLFVFLTLTILLLRWEKRAVLSGFSHASISD